MHRLPLAVVRPSRLAHAFVLIGSVACSSATDHPTANEPAPPEPTIADAPSGPVGPRVVALTDSVPEVVRDLAAVRAAQRLRVLVRASGSEPLPRDVGLEDDYRLAVGLAEELGVELDLVVAPADVSPAGVLAEGRADVATPGCARGFDVPGVAVDALAVGSDAAVVAMRANQRPRPRRLRDLARAKMTVRASGPDVVGEASTKHALGKSTLVTVLANADAGSLLTAVASIEADGAIVFRRELEAFRAYDDSVTEVLVVKDKIPLSWLVPKSAPALRQAVKNYAYAMALTTHQRLKQAGDLDAIRKRGALRVAMLNNAASFFVYRGQQLGFQYELAALLASRLGVRLEVVVPSQPDAMRALLLEGSVDLIPIAPLGDDQDADVTYSRPIMRANQVLVQRRGETPITAVVELAGKAVHVRASSAYVPALEKLRAQVPTLTVVDAAEDLETEDLIDKVGRGELPLTVANAVLLAAETAYRDDVFGSLVLASDRPLVYGTRASTPKLSERLDALLERELAGAAFARIDERYFTNRQKMQQLTAGDAARSGVVSPYDEVVRRYATQFGLDWRLILAQMYEESRFDPKARSWVGAIGLLQLMPRTAAELGVGDVRHPETNIHAGTKYLARLLSKTDASLPMRQRVRFALAGYNAGMGHVEDARRLARRLKLDPDRWFGNVEKTIQLLEHPRYYRRARYGYCRGREPAAYVSRIQSKYDAYVTILPGVLTQ
ncbi:MAG: transglycosylase SLT domain-containing protein [Myxococcota bacterium]